MATKKETRIARLYAALMLSLALAVGVGAYMTGQATYEAPPAPPPALDIFAYNHEMVALANYGTTSAATGIAATSTLWTATSSSIWSPKNPWPVSAAYPRYGAILPFYRVVAYYGNFASTQMGILGEYPPDIMLSKLESVAADWQAADPSTPVIPALDYIAVTAQKDPGPDRKYRLRMPESAIEEAISLASSIHGIAFLDVQPGLSDLRTELPLLEKYLAEPNVELAIDPEFSMKDGAPPGTEIGTFSAADINYAASFLAGIVDAHGLPPKILVVHRFTPDMLTDYKDVKPLPEVEIVVNMDGWSTPERKTNIYGEVVKGEPIQFAGIKLFYKNDVRPPSPGLMTPAQILGLKPTPIFIEYQ
ncbi:MAG: hypothetical protein KGI79_01650 [Patescibacteria group bacterium]|nr:hypothetical protein [Patescibacteria group bacterium]MDE2116561.1 hypothetical protein [Patescibacteria group bacterium]